MIKQAAKADELDAQIEAAILKRAMDLASDWAMHCRLTRQL